MASGRGSEAREPLPILVVDDDPLLRRALAGALAGGRRKITDAPDGIAAWECFQAERPRLLVTDWEMPGLSGLGLIRRIREAQFTEYVYIILLTAHSDVEDLVVGLDAGADDYLAKPFDVRELRARVAIGERLLDLQDRLRRAAATDALTGLLNRGGIERHATAELARCQRGAPACCLALVDVDHFKRVNDSHGHVAGDQVLQAIAKCIAEQTRPYDFAGRWGGDEFLVVLPDTSLDEAAAVANRVRRAVRRATSQLVSGGVSISVGLASTSGAGTTDLGELMREADRALYRVKAGSGAGAIARS